MRRRVSRPRDNRCDLRRCVGYSIGIPARATSISACDGWLIAANKATTPNFNNIHPSVVQQFTILHLIGQKLILAARLAISPRVRRERATSTLRNNWEAPGLRLYWFRRVIWKELERILCEQAQGPLRVQTDIGRPTANLRPVPKTDIPVNGSFAPIATMTDA